MSDSEPLYEECLASWDVASRRYATPDEDVPTMPVGLVPTNPGVWDNVSGLPKISVVSEGSVAVVPKRDWLGGSVPTMPPTEIPVTEEMIAAGLRAEANENEQFCITIYRAMAAVAPADANKAIINLRNEVKYSHDDITFLIAERDAALARAEAAEKSYAEIAMLSEELSKRFRQMRDRALAAEQRLRERDAGLLRLSKNRNPG